MRRGICLCIGWARFEVRARSVLDLRLKASGSRILGLSGIVYRPLT